MKPHGPLPEAPASLLAAALATARWPLASLLPPMRSAGLLQAHGGSVRPGLDQRTFSASQEEDLLLTALLVRGKRNKPWQSTALLHLVQPSSQVRLRNIPKST